MHEAINTSDESLYVLFGRLTPRELASEPEWVLSASSFDNVLLIVRPPPYSTPPTPRAASRATASAPSGARRACRRVLHPGRVERRPPTAIVVLGQLQVIPLAVHPDGDVPDAGPGVEPGAECPERWVIGRRRAPGEADSRTRRSWPRRSSTVFYSMTWSARPSTDGGIVRPSALAVFRLMTSSNFVGCSTGRLAGFAPLRILST